MKMHSCMQSYQMSECTNTQTASLCALTDAAAAVSVFVIPERRISLLALA